MPRNPNAKALTTARGAVHGNFMEGSTFTARVMELMHGTTQWPNLNPAQQEALHMIVHKTHRILTGNPHHHDHWDDIGGYAHLGAEACESLQPAKRKAAKSTKRVKSKKLVKKRVKKQVTPRSVRQGRRRPVVARPARSRTNVARRPRAQRPAPVAQAAE